MKKEKKTKKPFVHNKADSLNDIPDDARRGTTLLGLKTFFKYCGKFADSHAWMWETLSVSFGVARRNISEILNTMVIKLFGDVEKSDTLKQSLALLYDDQSLLLLDRALFSRTLQACRVELSKQGIGGNTFF